MRAVEQGAVCAEDERAVLVAPSSISLQSLIELRQRTGHPVLLAEDGEEVGVCGEVEIIRALAARRPASVA